MYRLEDWGILVLRVVVGIVFLVHGAQKLFFFGFGGVTQTMSGLGIWPPQMAAIVVTLVEFVGGILLIIGLFTRWAALLLAVDMLMAILTVHLRNGFFMPSGFEYPLTLLGTTVALALIGPGEVSVEQRVVRHGMFF